VAVPKSRSGKCRLPDPAGATETSDRRPPLSVVVPFPVVTDRTRFPPFLRVLNVLLLIAIYAPLLLRTGRFSPAYRAALVAGALVIAAAVLRLFSRDPFGRRAGKRRAGRTVRTVLALGPWVGVSAVVLVDGVWWCQQSWALRLFATYSFAVWSLACYGAAAWYGAEDAQSAAAGQAVSRLLAGFAGVLGILGIDGLAFGLTPFGATTSAGLACAAAALVGVALFARRSTRDKVAALTFGVVFGLVAVEAGIRLLRVGENLREVDDPEYVRQFHHITPPRSAFVNRPNPLDEFPPALVETNSLGIRGPEIQPGPVDLLLIGDSMIEARQLPWERTLSARLPEAFAARSVPLRVVGHGMRGWSPLLEWNWYLKVGRQLKPRTVLLFFFWNDLWSVGDEVDTFQAVMRPDGRPDHFDVRVDPGWVWYKHVRTVRIAESMLQQVGLSALRRSWSLVGERGQALDLPGAEAAARRMAGDALLASDEVDALLTKPMADLSMRLQGVARTEFWPGIRPLTLWTDAQWKAAAKIEAELRLFAEDVAGAGGRLVLVYVPNSHQIAASECSVGRYLEGLDGNRLLPAESGIQDWLKAAAARLGLELLDPSEAMRAYHRQRPEAAPLYLRADCHWSERGHQFMADYLAEWYLRSLANR
jgi:hypothetical protein